jgi:HD superfamily phosphohydrolase
VNTEHDCLVVNGEKGMLAVENYLYARYSMYLQVYQHKKCLATDSLLQKLFKRVKVLVRNKRITYLESELYNWVMSPDTLTVKDFLKIDDTYVLHHIKHWVDERDYILKDLARRFTERDIFKAYKVDDATKLDARITALSEDLRKRNLDPEYYIDVMKIASSPYSFYNPDASDYSRAIFVENNDGTLTEISQLSHVVNALVKNNYENTWLISLNKKELEAMPLAGARAPETAFNLAQF